MNTNSALRNLPSNFTSLTSAQHNTSGLSTDRILHAVGILDQAILGLLDLRRFNEAQEPTRSLLLDLMQVYNQFYRNRLSGDAPNPISQFKLLATTGGCAMKLISNWKEVISPEISEQSAQPKKDYGRYYKIASLGVVSLVIPWLILRKR